MNLTSIQEKARGIFASAAIWVMLFGGSRSGKTFIIIRAIIIRAMKAPYSRHAILRFRFNHCKQAIIYDTFPKVMRLCFPNIYDPSAMNKTDFFYTLPNGAELWFGGLDDKERTEKILGNEYVTIFLSECSQIAYSSVELVKTRLAQKVDQVVGGIKRQMIPKMFFDCNPPTKAHWSYRVFFKKQHPVDKHLLPNPENYAQLQMNPKDNEENLPAGYIDNTLKSLSAAKRIRFLEGKYADDNPNALFSEIDIDKWRHTDGPLPDFQRIVIGVDPSGSGDEDNLDNDEIGIVVGALGVDGNAYLIEDSTLKAGPGTWGKVVVNTFDRLEADVIVGEVNYGGAMVDYVIKTCAKDQDIKTVYKEVTASRGKVVRAEPFSALYEQGKIRHVGYFTDLEDEAIQFSTLGYLGEGSPNRMDAWIWVLSELFPGLLKQNKKDRMKHAPIQSVKRNPHKWGSRGQRRR